MQKEEFQALIGKEISDEDFKEINKIYLFHPSIPEVAGKTRIATIYKIGGMGIINDMMETANDIAELEEELHIIRNREEHLISKIVEIKERFYFDR